MDRRSDPQTSALVVLALLGALAALALMKAILVPLAFALLLACLLSPATHILRRVFRVGSTGAAVLLFVLLTFVGLYVASLTAESLVQAANTLPSDAERVAGQASKRVTDLIRSQPAWGKVLPDPKTIDILGDRNKELLVGALRARLGELSGWVGQGLVVLILVLFLLVESEMLMPKLVRFVAASPGDARAAERSLNTLIRQLRAYLVARTLINFGMGLVVAVALRLLHVEFPVALGAIAGLLNFIPYVGQVIGGALPVLVCCTLAVFQMQWAEALTQMRIVLDNLSFSSDITPPVQEGVRMSEIITRYPGVVHVGEVLLSLTAPVLTLAMAGITGLMRKEPFPAALLRILQRGALVLLTLLTVTYAVALVATARVETQANADLNDRAHNAVAALRQQSETRRKP